MNVDKSTDHPLLDMDILRSRERLADDFLPLVFKAFTEEVPVILGQITECLDSMNKTAIKQLCHKLLGMSINVGAARLSEMGKQLEKEIDYGTRSAIEYFVNKMDTVFEQTIQEYRVIRSSDSSV